MTVNRQSKKVMNLPKGYILQKGKYELTQVVGQGGFGITYQGKWFTEVKGPLGTLKTEVPICIKEYFFKDYCFRDPETKSVRVHSETGKILFEKFKEKLIKEAKILSDVTHPYIVNVLEVFEENETAYIVMEYISGCSLKYMLDEKGILPENKVLKYTRQIGEALRFVHKNSILHLDIKPSNILIDKDDNARLIDFGVSKRYDIEEQETSTTMLTLSKGFASIEQYDDEGTQVFSPCPDIYSLGATMYNLLTSKTPTESILRVAHPLTNPSGFNPAITPKTEAAILKAMEIIPENRFQSAGEMLDALDIPKEEPAEKNPLRETISDGGEETVLLKDDQTRLSSSRAIVPEDSKKKKSKMRLSGVYATLLLILVAGVVFFAKRVSSEPGETPNEVSETTELLTDNTIPTDKEADEVNTSEDKEQEAEKTTDIPLAKPAEAVTATIDASPKTEESAPKNVKDEVLKPEAEKAGADLPSVEIEENYARLIASGKKKMDIFDFSGARQDFISAKALKNSEDVDVLITLNRTKETEKKISDKKTQYEEKMSFGFNKIVRKKDSGKYGAINNLGEETIPCIYIGVGLAEIGRAFEREDHLFDIYNSEGELLGEGLTYY